jgi:hypothetical protein
MEKIRMSSNSLIIFFIPFLVMFVDTSYAQVIDSVAIYINKTHDFPISGDGNSINWQNEKWLILPEDDSSGVAYQTKLKLLYSDSGIYCLYHCEDRHITATLKEDFSDLFNEDVVEVFFWPDFKVPIYFEYELSPLNHELPLIVPNLNGNFLGWRPWHYEGNRKTRHTIHMEMSGSSVLSWTAEFFIPFALLKPMNNVPPAHGTRWRANFYRIDYDHDISSWSWKPVKTNFHEYEKFGTVIFN